MIFTTTYNRTVLSITPAMTDRANSYRVWVAQIDGAWCYFGHSLASVREWFLARTVADVVKPQNALERWELVAAIDRLFAQVKRWIQQLGAIGTPGWAWR